MRETPLYQGEQVKAPVSPHAELPNIQLPENPAPKVFDRAINTVQQAIGEYAELKDYQKQLESARKRKANEVDFRMEMKRRAELPWGSDGSIFHADGTMNEEAISGVVTQFQERNLATRGDYWLRKNNVREEEGLLMENEMLRLNALEMLGNQERQNIERSFRDTLQMMMDTEDYDGAYATIAGGVRRGLMTPQRAESAKVEVDNARHSSKQKALTDRVNGYLARGEHDELTDAFLNGDFDELDYDAQIRLRRQIDRAPGRMTRRTVKGSGGKAKTVPVAPDGLPKYAVDAFNLVHQKGDARSMEERAATRAALTRYALQTITTPGDASAEAQVRDLGRMLKLDDKFVSAVIEQRAQAFGGTAKFNVDTYVTSIATNAHLLTGAQFDEMLRHEEVLRQQQDLKNEGSEDFDEEAYETASYHVKRLQGVEKAQQEGLRAAVTLALVDLDNRNKDASYSERCAVANQAAREFINNQMGGDASAVLESELQTWEGRANSAREAHVAASLRGHQAAAETPPVSGTPAESAAPAAQVESFDLPSSVEVEGAEGKKQAILYVPRGSKLAGKKIMVFSPASGCQSQVLAMEADVQTPALSFRAHVQLGNRSQTLRRLRVCGNEAVLEGGYDDGLAPEDEYSEEEAVPVSDSQTSLFPDEEEQDGYAPPTGELPV